MIKNIKELNIQLDRLYTTLDIWRMLNKIKPTSIFTATYYLRQGYIKAVKGKKYGFGQNTYLAKGSDLERFIVQKYF